MGIDQTFTFGDAATLPMEPLEYITRQAQAFVQAVKAAQVGRVAP